MATLRKERRRAYHREQDRKRVEGARAPVDAQILELRLGAQLANSERGLTGPAAARTRELLEDTTGMAEATGFGNFPGAIEGKDSRKSPKLSSTATSVRRSARTICSGSRRRRSPDWPGCPRSLTEARGQRFQPWEKGRTHRGQQRSAAAAS